MKLVLGILGTILSFFLVLIIIATFSDYRPDQISEIQSSDSPDVLLSDAEFDVFIWNIGYCGLDASMDFFYDGGESVRPPEKNVIRNLQKVRETMENNDSVEFFLLQEVDVDSKRSYGINEYDSIRNSLSEYYDYLGINYDVFFVPLPFLEPMGRVNSGLVSLSRYLPSEVKRYSFPGNYSWPKNLFMLDRCFLVSRFKLSGGKELLIINTHNSAYDDGSLRRMQMEYLRDFIISESDKGNFLIVGGDWNQSPPACRQEFEGHVFDTTNYSEIPYEYLPPGWTWAFDERTPTNRRVSSVYKKAVSPTTLIDFFLASPGLRILKVKGVDQNFRYSDHQPVIIKVRIIGLGTQDD